MKLSAHQVRNGLACSALALALSACGGATKSTTPSLPSSIEDSEGARKEAKDTTPGGLEEPHEDKREDEVIEVEGLRIAVVRDEEGNESIIATDARSLFDEANDALAEGDGERALALYDELLTDFSDSSLARPALYNAGLALEGMGRVDDAVQRYLGLAAEDAQGSDGIDARIRAAALYAEHARWSEALGVLDALLARPGLSISDSLETRARRGYVLLEAKDYSAAETALSEAIAFYEKHAGGDEPFEGDYFIGMAHFYLGDIPRRQFDAIPIRLPEDQMARDVETKASLVLLASERFGSTVELGNIYWATAAGFRLADMQHNFWRSLVTAPVPPKLSEEASALYVSEVHRRSLSLLQKALSIHGKNVQLATLYKSQTPWSEASEEQVLRLTEAIGREQAGEFLSVSEVRASDARLRASTGEYIPGRLEL